ncbi:hypothetical protein B0H63DRAFT_446767 [Podospora didyma]|uniref:Uncharacterized protein n=1 Tax=Podospora didyma TaxID=330526 RepID=A0AAE0U4U9_9PEZI|nr:hypothetical protein B0H63DRAFT_446767 [Podospora didyma]
MQTPAQQPRLKKRASIRDRLRGAWQKPATTTLPALQEEAKPRFVYTPKHAAADFSRLAISPTSPPLLRQRQHRISTSVEARPALSPRQEVDTGALAAKPQRPQPPQLQTLQENEAAAPVARKESRSRRHNKTVTTDENISRGRVRSSPPRNSLTLVENPWEASQPLVDSQPIADQKPRNRSDDSPPSDYEAFIARAAAEDRAHREQVWRTISQRSAVLKPNPHLQYASARSSADISAGSTAVAGNKTSAGDGSRSSGSRRESGQYYTIGRGSSDEQQFRRSHSKRASWAPSYDASGGDVEKSLEKKTPRQHQQQQPIVLGVDENFRPSSRMVEQQQQQQPMRTLRRQGSISQRIAEYIRPAREDITEKYEQPVRRPSSRAGMRRSGSQAHHPIETLAE